MYAYVFIKEIQKVLYLLYNYWAVLGKGDTIYTSLPWSILDTYTAALHVVIIIFVIKMPNQHI